MATVIIRAVGEDKEQLVAACKAFGEKLLGMGFWVPHVEVEYGSAANLQRERVPLGEPVIETPKPARRARATKKRGRVAKSKSKEG